MLEDRRAAGIGERDVAKADLARRQARGRGARARRRARRPAPSPPSSRSTAATGAAAPSSAQLNPPNAISDTPIAACAKTTTSPSEMRPAIAADASDQNTSDVGAEHEQQAPEHRLLAQPRRLVLQRVQPRAPGDEALDRPAGEAEQPQLLRRRRIDGEAVGVVGVALRARAPRRCCDRARRRSRAAASASRARRRRARSAPTTRRRTAAPPRRGRRSSRPCRRR